MQIAPAAHMKRRNQHAPALKSLVRVRFKRFRIGFYNRLTVMAFICALCVPSAYVSGSVCASGAT